MKEKKASKKASILVSAAAALALVAAVTLTIVFVGRNNDSANLPDKPAVSSEKPDDSGTQKPDDSSGEKPNDEKPNDDGKQDEPSSTKIVFAVPVVNGTCIKEYTEASVVFNKTLGVYTGHMGMDFAADENAKVVAAYDGTVVSVTKSYLEGTTVKIDHGNGLVSVYNSVEINDDIVEGKTLKKGDEIGSVSTNNRQEYKDGAHLHFEVYENGTRVSPLKYLEGVEK
ncbi:MAG TPA: hypothetical protein DDY77_03820 [Clostridiales bacterium]|nr:hypothetical protein [Clostridiales bacterium]